MTTTSTSSVDRSLFLSFAFGLALLLAWHGLAEQARCQPAGGGAKVKSYPVTVLDVDGELTAKDPVQQGAHFKVHPIKLEAGSAYRISLRGVAKLDTYLRIEDAKGKVLAEDDDSGGDLNAQIIFAPPQTQTYNIVATTFEKGATGKYWLNVQRGNAEHQKEWEVAQLRNLADEAHRQQRLPEALAFQEKTLALVRKHYGSAAPEVVASLKLLADWRTEAAEFPAARQALQEILDIRRQSVGDKHWQVRDAQLALANLGLWEKLTIPQRRAVVEADDLCRKAVQFANKRKWQEALPLARKSVAIMKENIGEEQPWYINCLNDLGWILRELKELKEAETLLRRNVELREKVYGPDHPQTAHGLSVLGWLYAYRRAWGDAEDCFRKAEKKLRASLPDDDQRIAQALENHWRLTNFRLGAVHDDQVNKLDDDQRQRLAAARKVLDGIRDQKWARKNLAAIRTMRTAVQELFELLGPDDPQYLNQRLNLAYFYGDMGDDDRAAPIFREVLKAQTRIYGEAHPNIVDTLDTFADYQKNLGDQKEAEKLRAKADKIVQELRLLRRDYVEKTITMRLDLELYSSAELRNLSKLGRHLFDQGDYAKAEELLRGVVERCKKLHGEEHADFATALEDLASLHADMGDYSRAEPMYLQVRDLRLKLFSDKHPHYGVTLHNLALLYARLGHHAKAVPLLLTYIKIQQTSPQAKAVDHAHALITLGYVYSHSKELAKAETANQDALKLLKGQDEHPLFATALSNWGFVCKKRGDFKRAETLLKQALELRGKHLGKKHPDYADSLHDLAVVYDAMGLPAQAEPLIREALGITRDSIDAARVVQSQRQQLAMAASMRSYLDTFLSQALRADWPADKVYQEVLNWKGTVFANRQRSLAAFAEPFTEKLPDEMDRLLYELKGTASDLARCAFTDRDDVRFLVGRFKTPEEEHAAWKRQLDELTEKRERLEVELLRLTGKLQAGQRKSVTAAQVQAALPPDGVLIDYVEFQHTPRNENQPEPRLAAFIIRPGRPAALVDLGPMEPIGKLVGQRSALLKSSKGQRPGAELRRLLWTPLEDHLKDAKMVLISPDGVLGQVPFAALPGRDRDKYLLEEVALVVAPLPQLLPELLARPSRNAAAQPSLLLVGDVAFGDPAAKESDRRQFGLLPATRGEILAIRDSFENRYPDGNVLMLRAGRAKKQVVHNELARHRWIHLATHGFFADPTRSSMALVYNFPAKSANGEELLSRQDIGWFHPWVLSGLALAGANRTAAKPENSGILTALEVAQLNLKDVELVVLSACETGLGAAAKGEGIQSLQQAFQIAGTRCVVGSLWSVDDRYTRLLMERFYENLWDPKAKDISRVEALRQAQLWMLREGNKRNLVPLDDEAADRRVAPYYWAAFVLSGDWR